MRYWTAAATRNSQEQRAAHHVERQGFQFYLPQILSRRGMRERRELLFPGYIFVRIAEGWEALASTRGISRLFMCGDRPAPMPSSEIDSLRSREDDSGFIRLHPRLPDGAKVVLKDGAWAGMFGILEETTASDRCRVLLSVLGRSVRGEFDRSIIAEA